MSTLYVDTINEKTSGNGVQIPGHVVQVVSSSTTTQVINSSASVVSTGISASITPTSSSSKVMVAVSSTLLFGSNSGNLEVVFSLKRGGTTVATAETKDNTNAIVHLAETISMSYLDSPATTSATTYEVFFQETASINRYGSTAINYNGRTGTITLMEIAQ